MTPVVGKSVDIWTSEGIADAYIATPNDGAAHPGVLYYMDIFGLRPWARAMVARIAAAGYTVLAPNVLYRHGRAPVVPLPGFIDAADREVLLAKLRPLVDVLCPVAMSDALVYLDWLAEDPHTLPGPVGITGYCMGARLAMRTAGTYPDRVAAAGCFHGGNMAVDEPTSPHWLADRITAELYFGHADGDPQLPPQQMQRLKRALDDAGVRYRAEVYWGIPHGWTQADTARFHVEAAERHFSELLDLFARTLHPAAVATSAGQS